MRKIKFRVWDKTHKQFLPLEVYNLHSMTSFNSFGVMRKDWKNYSEGEYFYEDSQVLEQFTGLKDKNEIEIYEGDIVNSDGYVCQVIFITGAFKIAFKNKNSTYTIFRYIKEDLTVISNIHENQ